MLRKPTGEETGGRIVKAAIVVGVDSRVVRNKSNGIASYWVLTREPYQNGIYLGIDYKALSGGSGRE